ncbi:glycosyltransferase family 4 protein [Clostridium saudiense]|nr:glycosyltransferase family 4 protein [Clostridium saudiense]
MKICFLGDAASIHIRRWCEYFRDKGDEVSIISFRNAKISGVKVIFIGNKLNINSEGGNLAYLKKIRTIKKEINNIKPDIVNAHYLTSYGFLAALIGRKPLVVSTWGSDILVTPKRNIIYKKLTEFVIKRCNLITSDSNFMTEEIIALGGEECNIVTAPMGVDIANFNLLGRSKENKNTFLSMRTLCKNSNIEYILSAFKNVIKDKPDSKLVITNSGDMEDEILKLIKELGIESNVDFLGFINREKVEELLKNCDVYLSIPTSDSTSVNLLEAMACGIFPIVSNIPANKEWIKSEVNGLIVEELNVDKLTKIMIESLNNNSLRESAVSVNNKIISERAIWIKNMAYIRENYLKLISKEE